MYLGRSKLPLSPSCPSGATWYACDSGSKFIGRCGRDPCSGACPERETQHVLFRLPQQDDEDIALERRDQDALASRTIDTPTAVPTSTLASSSPSSTPHRRPNTALIAGTTAAVFSLAVLIVAIILFYLHTRRSRLQHHLTLSRRLSGPGFGETGQMARTHGIPSQPPLPPSLRKASHSSSLTSPSLTSTSSSTVSTPPPVEPSPFPSPHHRLSTSYPHFSPDHLALSLPGPGPGPGPIHPTAWKTSHRPTAAPQLHLSRRSIATFELEVPVSPAEYACGARRASVPVPVSNGPACGHVRVPGKVMSRAWD